MTWVNELPTESGLYWSWSSEWTGDRRRRVVQTNVNVSYRGDVMVNWYGTREWVGLEANRAGQWWWWGPVASPDPPQDEEVTT